MTSKTYEVSVPEEGELRKKRCGCCAFLRFFLTVLAILSISVLAAFYAFNFIGYPFRGCAPPELDPYGKSNWKPGANMVTFECSQGHEMEGYESGGEMTSECVNREWVPQPPVCVTLPIRLECEVDQNGLKGTLSMWQEKKSGPTFVYGFLNIAAVPKVLTSLSEVIEVSRAKCHASMTTFLTLPDPTPLSYLEDEVEIRFETHDVVAYKKAELHVTLVFVDVPKALTRSVVSLHQGHETVVMDTPPGWPFGHGPKHRGHGQEVAIAEHGKNLEPAEKIPKDEAPGNVVMPEAGQREPETAVEKPPTTPVTEKPEAGVEPKTETTAEPKPEIVSEKPEVGQEKSKDTEDTSLAVVPRPEPTPPAPTETVQNEKVKQETPAVGEKVTKDAEAPPPPSEKEIPAETEKVNNGSEKTESSVPVETPKETENSPKKEGKEKEPPKETKSVGLLDVLRHLLHSMSIL